MEALDYRSSAWSLRDAHAPVETLARLEARPIAPENAAAMAAARFSVDGGARRRRGGALLARGFRYLGTKSESASFTSTALDVFVDPEETTYVAIRPWVIRRWVSGHFIATFFEDGSCIETVGLVQPYYGSAGMLTVRGGSGDLTRDIEQHLDAVRERARAGLRVIRVRDLSTVLRLSRFFVSHVYAPWEAKYIAQTRKRTLELAAYALVFAGFMIAGIFGR